MIRKVFFILILAFFMFVGSGVSADSVSERRFFYIDSSYDLQNREQTEAILVKITNKLYFYVDKDWWDSAPQDKVYQYLSELEQEFDNNIYPTLTSVFGSEKDPGIDNDSRITVLVHPMGERAGGYFRSNDEYPKIQVPDSNQREMLYINSQYITTNLAKSFLAHEFTHLITFGQKESAYGVTEDVWLNEARAEYAITLAGYDKEEESNLSRRIKSFLEDPSDSIVSWQGTKKDYAALNLFTQYLVDHYGVKILADSLNSGKTGIESLNYALGVNGYVQKLNDIFFDWVIAVLINDCSYGKKYCYLNTALKNLHVNSKINFLPVSGESSLSYADFSRKWGGNWYKIIGGNSDLKVSFTCRSGTNFKLPYIVQSPDGFYKINFLNLDKDCSGSFILKNFGKDIVALYLIPSAADSVKGDDAFYPFSWTVSIEKSQDNANVIQGLLDQIAFLKAEIVRVQIQIAAMSGNNYASVSTDCPDVTADLFRGISNQQVSCLQQFLKKQGVYPEGLITGYFGILTQNAVVRFQEKYAAEILFPLGLVSGTGYVGFSTRAKINQLY